MYFKIYFNKGQLTQLYFWKHLLLSILNNYTMLIFIIYVSNNFKNNKKCIRWYICKQLLMLGGWSYCIIIYCFWNRVGQNIFSQKFSTSIQTTVYSFDLSERLHIYCIVFFCHLWKNKNHVFISTGLKQKQQLPDGWMRFPGSRDCLPDTVNS